MSSWLSLLALLISSAVAPPASELPALRAELLARVNAERAVVGSPPLAPSPALDRVAQARAEELGSRGSLPEESEAMRLFGLVQRRLAAAGYHAHAWNESATAVAGPVEEVVAVWKEGSGAQEALGVDYQHLGVGVAAFRGAPFYVFIAAWPESEWFDRRAAPLADLERVREEMLASANAERRAAGRPPLSLDPRLNEAAQRHAEDMLARAYYAHTGSDGSVPRGRVRRTGFPSRLVAENIAEGHFSVESVMSAWMASSDHRRNLLEPRLTHLGIGLAIGRWEDRYHLLWVQEFARPE